MTTVLYHYKQPTGCIDGFSAAWCAWRKFKDQATYLPIDYGDPPPLCARKNSQLFLLDFSFPRETMEQLCQVNNQVIVLDHHETAKKNFENLEAPNLTKIFSGEKSGCVLAWEYFSPEEPLPKFLAYVDDRDRWQWKLPNSREYNAYIGCQPLDFPTWDCLATNFENPYISREFRNSGAAVLQYQKQLVDSAVKGAWRWVIAGNEVAVVNSSLLQSEIGEALNRAYPNDPFSAIYHKTSSAEEVWSLRTKREDTNVAEIAKRYGGGGHKGAAGFRLTQTEENSKTFEGNER